MKTASKPLLNPQPGRRLSEVLRELQAGDGPRVSVGDILAALGARASAPLLVVFAAPNLLLFVPGASVFTAIPLAVVAGQLILGRPETWLPGVIASRAIDRSAFDRVVNTVAPRIERIERLARPRWWPASARLAEVLIGAATLILAIFLFLPIPFANGLPALAIVLLALGLSEKDGYWLAAGLAFTLLSVAVVAGMVFLGGLAVLEVLVR